MSAHDQTGSQRGQAGKQRDASDDPNATQPTTDDAGGQATGQRPARTPATRSAAHPPSSSTGTRWTS